MSNIGSKLDANQVLKQAYDDANNRLRVDATVSASIGDVSIVDANTGDPLTVNPDGSINTNITGNLQIEISAADGDNIAISDGVDTLDINSDGSLNAKITGPVQTIDNLSISGSLRVDQVSPTLLYIGQAYFGALDNEPKWQIKKIDLTTGVSIKNASDSFNNVWNNRAALTYV